MASLSKRVCVHFGILNGANNWSSQFDPELQTILDFYYFAHVWAANLTLLWRNSDS